MPEMQVQLYEEFKTQLAHGLTENPSEGGSARRQVSIEEGKTLPVARKHI